MDGGQAHGTFVAAGYARAALMKGPDAEEEDDKGSVEIAAAPITAVVDTTAGNLKHRTALMT